MTFVRGRGRPGIGPLLADMLAGVLLLALATVLIVAGAVPIVLDLRGMRAPVAKGATHATEMIWAAIPLVFAVVLIVLAARAA